MILSPASVVSLEMTEDRLDAGPRALRDVNEDALVLVGNHVGRVNERA